MLIEKTSAFTSLRSRYVSLNVQLIVARIPNRKIPKISAKLSKFCCSDVRVVRASDSGAVGSGFTAGRFKPITLNWYYTASCLTLSIKETVWRTSRRDCLWCRWENHLKHFGYSGQWCSDQFLKEGGLISTFFPKLVATSSFTIMTCFVVMTSQSIRRLELVLFVFCSFYEYTAKLAIRVKCYKRILFFSRTNLKLIVILEKP